MSCLESFISEEWGMLTPKHFKPCGNIALVRGQVGVCVKLKGHAGPCHIVSMDLVGDSRPSSILMAAINVRSRCPAERIGEDCRCVLESGHGGPHAHYLEE